MGYFQKLREEREENRRKNPENKPTQFQATMRLVCGGYLWYLIYQIVSGGGLKQTAGGQLILMVLALVLFAVVGGYCLFDGFKMFKNQDFYNPNAPFHGEEKETEESVSADPEDPENGSEE